MPKKEAPHIRFTNGYAIDDNDCWIWTKSRYKNGYGWLKVFGKVVSAHRYSYELYYGEIPENEEILHSCDVKPCVNPDHLKTGSHKANMMDAAKRGLMKSGKDHHMYGKKNPRPKQAKPVRVLGVDYRSQNEAERILGLGSGTVRYWIKNHPNKAIELKKGN